MSPDSVLKDCSNNHYKYNRLVETLLYRNEDKLALKLDPNMIDMCDLKRCDPKLPYKNEFSFLKDEQDVSKGYEVNQKCDLNWEDKSDSTSAGERYFMDRNAESFGFCLLINNYFTKGTYKEMQKFRNIFYQLNYDVIMEKNLTAEEIKNKLIEISQNERLKDHSAFVFMIITHGSADRLIYGFDGKPLQIDSLISIINCKNLTGKPKIFFFNSCRTGIKIYLVKFIFEKFSKQMGK